MVCRGQLFPQFPRGQLEELPEAQVGQLQVEKAVRRLILAVAGSEPPQVPVQPLQVQQPLAHLPVPGLLHPRHAVDALDAPTKSGIAAVTTASARWRSLSRPSGVNSSSAERARPQAASAASARAKARSAAAHSRLNGAPKPLLDCPWRPR